MKDKIVFCDVYKQVNINLSICVFSWLFTDFFVAGKTALLQFHFESEHAIDGAHSALEAHFVHMNKNVAQCVD